MKVLTREQAIASDALTKHIKEFCNKQDSYNFINIYTFGLLSIDILTRLVELLKSSNLYKGKFKAKTNELDKIIPQMSLLMYKMFDTDIVPAIATHFEPWYRLIDVPYEKNKIDTAINKCTLRLLTVWECSSFQFFVQKEGDDRKLFSRLWVAFILHSVAADADNTVKQSVREEFDRCGVNYPISNTGMGILFKDISKKCLNLLELMELVDIDDTSDKYQSLVQVGGNLTKRIIGKGWHHDFEMIIDERRLCYQYQVFHLAAKCYRTTHKIEPMIREALKQFPHYRHHTLEVLGEIRKISKLESSINKEGWEIVLDDMTDLFLPHLTQIQKESFKINGDIEEHIFQDVYDNFINNSEL